jgi:hypothetical protein
MKVLVVDGNTKMYHPPGDDMVTFSDNRGGGHDHRGGFYGHCCIAPSGVSGGVKMH